MKTTGPTFLAVLVAAALAPGPARAAGWEKWSGGSGHTIFLDVATPDGKNLVAAGMDLDLSGTFPSISPRVYSSSDSGRTFTDVSGTLAKLTFTTFKTVAAVDANRIWVAGGKKIWWTSDGAKTWPGSADVGLEDVQALHFMSALKGVALGSAAGKTAAIRRTGDGGKTWTSATLPATAGAVAGSFWLDERVGWACGFSEKSVGDPTAGGYDTPDQGYVLATTDGGATWTASAPIAGQGPTHLFFLRDGKTGWATTYLKEDATRSNAALYKTVDGGKTWTDAKIPLDVAKISMMGQTGSLNVSVFHALFFANEKVGHLGGSVYVADSDDGSGQTVHLFRTVDFRTQDGTTWDRTNLGTISLTGSMPNDGILASGAMTSLAAGWMVGEKSLVWGYTADPPAPCKSDTECAPGFGCNPFGKCQGVGCPDGCPTGQTCSWSLCRTPPDAGMAVGIDGSAPLQYDDAGKVVAAPDIGTVSESDDAGTSSVAADAGGATVDDQGCGCASGAGTAGTMAGLLALAFGLARRSKR